MVDAPSLASLSSLFRSSQQSGVRVAMEFPLVLSTGEECQYLVISASELKTTPVIHMEWNSIRVSRSFEVRFAKGRRIEDLCSLRFKIDVDRDAGVLSISRQRSTNFTPWRGASCRYDSPDVGNGISFRDFFSELLGYLSVAAGGKVERIPFDDPLLQKFPPRRPPQR